jgi:hypothetical protein
LNRIRTFFAAGLLIICSNAWHPFAPQKPVINLNCGQQTMESEPKKELSPRTRKLIYLAFFTALAVLILSQLPRGAYSTDLSRVGDGQPALVLAFDLDSMGAAEVMKLMDILRDDYADRVHFLIADLGTPQGARFAQRHRAINGTVMFYSGEGSHVRTIHQPPDTETLRFGLDEVVSG